jgi:transposase
VGSTHFLTGRLSNVKTEIGLYVLAYNLKRVIAIMGAEPLSNGSQ